MYKLQNIHLQNMKDACEKSREYLRQVTKGLYHGLVSSITKNHLNLLPFVLLNIFNYHLYRYRYNT